jgi:hypothetical protein
MQLHLDIDIDFIAEVEPIHWYRSHVEMCCWCCKYRMYYDYLPSDGDEVSWDADVLGGACRKCYQKHDGDAIHRYRSDVSKRRHEKYVSRYIGAPRALIIEKRLKCLS